MEFNGKYHKDQQLFVYCPLLRRLFWRRTRRNDLCCNVLYDSILNIYIYIHICVCVCTCVCACCILPSDLLPYEDIKLYSS